ncbi:MAG: ELM1/GtrOC1 family putative glycosyltransferase [Desulfuromusa sp.]|nr:ELM1/GtrOC1 family putative glycosyltransferase [Desulfuromusa sp.]
MEGKRLLILSDGKPGHVNQSIAFARHLGYDYDLCPVNFKYRGAKALSYFLDRLGIHSRSLFNAEYNVAAYTAVVSAGSGTYFANRALAKALACKSVAIMLPSGYRLDFDLIIAQQHDDPPSQANIIKLPINLTYVEPQGIVVSQPGEKYLALIIGGDSQHDKMDAAVLKDQLNSIFNLFPEHKVWMTTSRRTPKAVEEMLREFSYDRAVYYSQEPINPIPDYLQQCEYVFLTADSSSMMSESVSFGKGCVEVLPLADNFLKKSKFNTLIQILSEMNCLHVFDGSCGACKNKISLADIFNKKIIENFESNSV